MAVLLSSDAQVSRNADALKKSTISFRRKIGPQCMCGPFARKNLLRVSIQLLIFRYHGSTGAIDVILLRFKCQQADHFVGAL